MDARRAESLLHRTEEASASLRGPDAKSALQRLETEYGDLLVALQRFIDQGRTNEALRLANALYRFWITKQRFEDGAVWFDRVLASADGDEALRGAATLHAGFMPFWMGDDERASGLFGRAREIGLRREFERAARLVGAAEAIMEAQQMAWPPDERPHYERLLAVLPEAMGSADFDRARALGHSMSSNEAVAFALATPDIT